MNINVIGLDIAKQIFHLVALDSLGNKVLKKTLRRTKLLIYFANFTPCVIGMEGCASSHHWAREFRKLGHEVKLLPAQHESRMFELTKNDYNDALAIAEASRIPEMREVSVKTIEQQSIQAMHRLRRGVVADRTKLCNQVRGLLAEFGIIIIRASVP